MSLINDLTVTKYGNVTEVVCQQKDMSILWFGDLHADSIHTRKDWVHKMIRDNPDSYIVYGGDSIDVMQGRDDKRGSKGDNDINRSDYFNGVAERVRNEFYEPYKDRIIQWNRGNHDNSIIRKHEFDLLPLITDSVIGDFSGYIIFKLRRDNFSFISYVLYFQHAPNSGGLRSKGMLTPDIIRGQFPDADCYVTEHIHTSWTHPERSERINPQNNKLQYKTQWFIQVGTPKDEFSGSRNNFYHEKVKAGPQLISSAMINLSLTKLGERMKGKDNRISRVINDPKLLICED